MTLVHDRIAAEPQVHALLIGVGGYPFFAGGATPNPAAVTQLGVLRQLTSPPRSAAGLAEWLVRPEHAGRWCVPLGSVEVLASAPPGEPAPAVGGVAVERATLANVKRAYGEWRARCDRYDDDVALFYFCGHGLGKSDQYLLCEDAGGDALDLFAGGFTFEPTRRAFHQVKARTQLFFVDACRKVTAGMLNFQEPDAPLERAPFATTSSRHDLTVRAAAHDEPAFGPTGGDLSYFAQALVHGLEGDLATRVGGDWWVESGALASKLQDVLDLVSPGPRFRQRCVSTVGASTPLFRPPRTPSVRLRVTCVPEGANAEADLSCAPMGGGAALARQARTPEPWEVTVDAGVYQIRAAFDAGAQFQAADDFAFAMPPWTESPLRCLP